MDGYTMQEILEAAERAKKATLINAEGHGSFNVGASCMFANFVSEMIAVSTKQLIDHSRQLMQVFEEAV